MKKRTYPWVHRVRVLFIMCYVALICVDADKMALDNAAKVTKAHLLKFLELCWVKYVKAKIEPGEFN